jgi:RNA polymerase sigma-70 factor (ECF subfamily)
MDVAARSARPLPPAWHPVSHGNGRLEAVTVGTGQETDLVARAQSGDREAFEHLVRLHADRLYAVVLRALGDRHEAEEVVQETFLRAWRSLSRFEGRSQFFTWLYRIGVNEARRSQERRRTRPQSAPLADAEIQVPDEREAPQARAETHELRRALEAAILALPLDYRMPLVLRDVEGLSTAQAAAVMELGEAAFKSRLHRARLAVRSAVEDLVPEEKEGR